MYTRLAKWLSLARKGFCSTLLSFPSSITVSKNRVDGTEKADLRFECIVGGLVRLILAIGFVILLISVGCDIEKCTLSVIKQDVAIARRQVETLISTVERVREQTERLSAATEHLENRQKGLTNSLDIATKAAAALSEAVDFLNKRTKDSAGAKP